MLKKGKAHLLGATDFLQQNAEVSGHCPEISNERRWCDLIVLINTIYAFLAIVLSLIELAEKVKGRHRKDDDLDN